MATEFKLPDLGENIESGDVVSLLVGEGDVIEANQPVVELETDKATVEVPCPLSGRVEKIHVQAGDTVSIGDVVLSVDENGEGGQAVEDKAEDKKEEPPKEADKQEEPPKETDESDESQEPADEQAETEPAAEEPPEEQKESQREPRAEAKESTDEAPPAEPKERASSLGTRETPPPAATAPVEAAKSVSAGGGQSPAAAGPATRRLARELGVDVSEIEGTGPGGRISEDDVKAAVRRRAEAQRTDSPQRKSSPAAQPSSPEGKAVTPSGERASDAYGEVRRERMTKIRQTIARNMARSASTIPHVTNFDDADITELNKIRKESAADYVGANVKLTMMPFVMKAVAHALKAHPFLNASIDEEADEILFKQYVNLGVAVDTERGLIVPVVRNVDHMTIPQIALALSTVAEQARSGQFAIDDLRGGTFTISNMGAIGGAYSTPIINHPEVGILLVGRSRLLPVALESGIEPRLMMPLSLSYDHRLVDGATAARFLNEVIAYLEAPGRLLLAP